MSKPTSAPPSSRGLPLAREDHLREMHCDLTRVPNGWLVRSWVTGESRLWLDRGNGWFEEQPK